MKNKYDMTFDKDTGITTFIIKNKLGHFYGTAKLHPDDSFSRFTGNTLANIRALIKMHQYELKITKAELRAVKRLLKDVERNCPNVPKNIKRRFTIQIKNYTNRIIELESLISAYRDHIPEYCDLKDTIIKKYKINDKDN